MVSGKISPFLDLIIGPMYSSKTTELLRRLNIYAAMDLRVLYVNAALDTRNTADFSTHNPTIGSIGNIMSIKVSDLAYIAEFLLINKIDVIGIDEAQFMPDLKKYVMNFVEEKKIYVIVAGLSGDHMRNPFGEVLDLIPLCDNLQKLFAYCVSCRRKDGIIREAPFTKRIVAGGDVVLIGGKETYTPVCRDCYLSEKVFK